MTEFVFIMALSSDKFVTCGLNIFLKMFLAKTDPVDKMIESVDDMPAAATAPMPITDTAVGHRYCKTIGNTNTHWSEGRGTSPSYVVAFQSAIIGYRNLDNSHQQFIKLLKKCLGMHLVYP